MCAQLIIVPVETINEIFAVYGKESLTKEALEHLKKVYDAETLKHLDWFFTRDFVGDKAYIFIPSRPIYSAFKQALGIGGRKITLQEYLGVDFLILGIWFEEKVRAHKGIVTLEEKKKSELPEIETVETQFGQQAGQQINQVRIIKNVRRNPLSCEVLLPKTKGELRIFVFGDEKEAKKVVQKLREVQYIKLFGSSSKAGIVKIDWSRTRFENI